MHIVLVGLNHRSAPVELRERLAFRPEQIPGALDRLRRGVGLDEAAILSTCNRVEIYGAVADVNGTVDRLHQFFSEHSGVDRAELARRLYSCTEPQSIHHLFAVASGLDSMVIGEAEVLAQVKQAYAWARECQATGKAFNVLFQRALNAAKAVRTETAIGRGGTSIGAVSVELAGRIFKRLSEAAVLLIGAGKNGEVTLKRLTERGVRDVRIMNRSPERAVHLATQYGATPLSPERLPSQLREVDIIISSTSAPSYLLRHPDVASAMRARHQRPLCLVDLGVPRNIEPEIGSLENVYLFDIDSLQGLVERSNRQRQEAVSHSQHILNRKAELFLSWWREERVRGSDAPADHHRNPG
jgi:glutamyl-tRNA reductase